MTKYGDIDLITTLTLPTLYHFGTFMTTIPSTSGRLHSEFVRLLFLQTHRETDHFFSSSGVQLPSIDRDMFHFRRAAFSQQLKRKVDLTLRKYLYVLHLI